jgi:hypothetical protein
VSDQHDEPQEPRFHEGGIVPRASDREVAAILQAGEVVLSLDDPRHRDDDQEPA